MVALLAGRGISWTENLGLGTLTPQTPIAHATDFFLVGNGTDESTKLTAFVNSAIANPGVPHLLERKTYGTTAVLPTINVGGVWIEGVPGSMHDVGSVLSGTVIKRLTSANANPMLTVAPAAGASNQALTGIRLRGIGFDCNSLAAIGLRVQSVRQCEFDVSGANSTSKLFDLSVISGSLGEAKDLQGNRFRLRGRQIESNATCLSLDGDATANVSMNEIWCEFSHLNLPAVVCVNSDNNQWRFVRTIAAGTATESIKLQGGATLAQMSRDEVFHQVTGNKAIKAYGTADYTVASYGHRILYLDTDNGTPAPVLGIGAWVECDAAQSYTPTITGSVGTGLTTSSVSASYIRQDAFVDVTIAFVKSAGTGYASLSATLPFACAGSVGFASVSKERASTGKLFSAYIDGSATTIVIQSADGATAIPNGTYSITSRYRAR